MASEEETYPARSVSSDLSTLNPFLESTATLVNKPPAPSALLSGADIARQRFDHHRIGWTLAPPEDLNEIMSGRMEDLDLVLNYHLVYPPDAEIKEFMTKPPTAVETSISAAQGHDQVISLPPSSPLLSAFGSRFPDKLANAQRFKEQVDEKLGEKKLRPSLFSKLTGKVTGSVHEKHSLEHWDHYMRRLVAEELSKVNDTTLTASELPDKPPGDASDNSSYRLRTHKPITSKTWVEEFGGVSKPKFSRFPKAEAAYSSNDSS